MNTQSRYVPSKILKSLETSCMPCLQHRRTSGLNLFTTATANSFTNFYPFTSPIVWKHKFRVVGGLQNDSCINIFSSISYRHAVDNFGLIVALFVLSKAYGCAYYAWFWEDCSWGKGKLTQSQVPTVKLLR